MGCGEERDNGLVEDFSRGIKDFGEAGLGGSEGVAEFEEGFGDGAGRGAGEADDTDAAAAGRGGDGDDGGSIVTWVHRLFSVNCLLDRLSRRKPPPNLGSFAQIFLWRVVVVEGACLQGGSRFRCGNSMVKTWWNVWWRW